MSRKHIMKCGNAVTDDGQVISRLERNLKQHVSNAGYARVELWSGGYGKKVSVHRLVAEAFVPNPENKPQVNHKDGDKLNNNYTNLEWVTQSENQMHAYELGLQKGYHVSGRKISKEHRAALCGSRWKGQKRKYLAGGIEFDTPEDAAKHHGVSRQTVYNRSASSNFPDWEIKIWREEK